jgi:hypothetical protein
VADDGEALEAQAGHDLEHVECHRSLRVGFVVFRRRRRTALSIATQVSTDDSESIG